MNKYQGPVSHFIPPSFITILLSSLFQTSPFSVKHPSPSPSRKTKKMFKTKSTPKALHSTQSEDQPPPPYSSSAPVASSATAAANATKTKTNTRMSVEAAKQWESFAKTPQMSLYDPFVLSMN